jgi:hypothetical protein
MSQSSGRDGQANGHAHHGHTNNGVLSDDEALELALALSISEQVTGHPASPSGVLAVARDPTHTQRATQRYRGDGDIHTHDENRVDGRGQQLHSRVRPGPSDRAPHPPPMPSAPPAAAVANQGGWGGGAFGTEPMTARHGHDPASVSVGLPGPARVSSSSGGARRHHAGHAVGRAEENDLQRSLTRLRREAEVEANALQARIATKDAEISALRHRLATTTTTTTAAVATTTGRWTPYGSTAAAAAAAPDTVGTTRGYSVQPAHGPYGAPAHAAAATRGHGAQPLHGPYGALPSHVATASSADDITQAMSPPHKDAHRDDKHSTASGRHEGHVLCVALIHNNTEHPIECVPVGCGGEWARPCAPHQIAVVSASRAYDTPFKLELRGIYFDGGPHGVRSSVPSL